MMKGLAACVSVLLFTAIALAEPPATISPLGDLPQGTQVKMARLAQILAGAIQSGRLSDATIQSAMASGDAPALIRSLGPEAAQLLQDIAAGLKRKYADEELSLLLGGLIGAK
jgi:hypothetical protein